MREIHDRARIRRDLDRAYAKPHTLVDVLCAFDWKAHPDKACEGLAEVTWSRLDKSEHAAGVNVAVAVRGWCNLGKGKKWRRCRYCPVYMTGKGVAMRSSWAWRLLDGISSGDATISRRRRRRSQR